MANSSNYRVQLRRRREGKTDYQARKALVISGRPRLVTRTSLKNSNAQIIIAKPIGDHTIAAANSRELVKKYGWKAPTGNIPAAYLTGLLCGLKAQTAGIDSAILDIGLIPPTKGAKIFAILHGVIDANITIPHGDQKIVEHRAKGDHIAYYAQTLQDEEEPQIYKTKFTNYTTQGITPQTLPEHFSQVRNNIINAFKNAKVAPEPPNAPKPKPKQKPKPETKPTQKPETKPTTTETPTTQPQKPKEPKPQTPTQQTPKTPETPTPKTEETQTKPKTEEELTAKPKVEEAKSKPKVEEAKSKPKAAKEKEPKEEAPAKATKAKAAPAKAATLKKAETAPAKAKTAKKTPTKEETSSKKKTPAKKAPAKAVAKSKKGEKKA
jgi:large subunit ribosomal protein L18